MAVASLEPVEEVYLQVLGPARRAVGDGWEAGTIGIVVAVPIDDDVIAATIAAVRGARSVPILLGGRAITSMRHATALGADEGSASPADALAWFEALDARTRRKPAPKPV